MSRKCLSVFIFIFFILLTLPVIADTANQNIQVGDYVTFGTYPQTSSGEDKTPIEWLVLARDGQKVLLISRYGLDCQPYNTYEVDTIWEKCTLRAWLNSTFINKAFTAGEKSDILVTNVDNSKSQCYSEWSTISGKNTQDKVFLLSYAEANKYFSVDNNENIRSCAAPTDYARKNGCSAIARIDTEGSLVGRSEWWLRSPGRSQSTAAGIDDDGFFINRYVNLSNLAVRPALWLNLGSTDIDEDASENAEAMQNEATYQKAERLYQAKDWESARAEYLKIPGYKDADVKAAICDNEIVANIPYTKVGNIVIYGHYEQDNNTSDGKEAIEWIVIKYDLISGKSLLLSRYGLDTRRFDASNYQGWDKSEIRTWLNSTFLNAAFTIAEQQDIATTTVKTSNNADWVAYTKKMGWSSDSLSGGADTQDKVFLLSLEEAMEYSGYTALENFNNSTGSRLRTTPTKYAIARGADEEYCNWWLRSPGGSKYSASYINFFGGLHRGTVSNSETVVRPAIWLNLGYTDIDEDASENAEAMQNEATYQKAERLYQAKDWKGARAEYLKIPRYKDAAAKAAICDKEIAAAHETAIAQYKKDGIQVGDYVSFGHYPQTEAGKDNSPVEWLVLDRSGNKVLLLSKYGLVAKKYDNKWRRVTWEQCTLRAWLNDDFFKKVFTKDEQKGILTTHVDNSASQCYDEFETRGGNNTQDKIFLLSYAEADKYLNIDVNMKSRVEPTAYALKRGAYTSSTDKTEDGNEAGYWWLRSPGFLQTSAANVRPSGNISSKDVNYDRILVRPAMWVNLDSGLF